MICETPANNSPGCSVIGARDAKVIYYADTIAGAIGPVSVSRYIARLRMTGADLDTNTIQMTDDCCSFRLMNIRKIRSYI